MESLVPDFRTNAKNILGMRGTHYAISPTKDSGVITMFDHAGSAATGGARWLGSMGSYDAPVTTNWMRK